ncbi:MAG TPA: hypothetical protein VMP01_11420 [Pirellulaceae bacterium]|nr:hypothetical protein [Pirellulaceae bacterium]
MTMKHSLRNLMIVSAGLGLFLLAAWGAFRIFREQGESIRDAYCLEWASEMVVRFMDETGKYPKDWSDLRHVLKSKLSSVQQLMAQVGHSFLLRSEKCGLAVLPLG